MKKISSKRDELNVDLLLDTVFNAHVRLKLIADMDFIKVILTEMKFHFER